MSTIHWEAELYAHYGLNVILKKLDGEYDLNFLAENQHPNRQGPNTIFKVMRLACDPAFIDLQCKAYQHIQSHNAEIPVPTVIKNTLGNDYCLVKDELGQERIIWLLQCLDGMDYADFKPHSECLINELGQKLGALDSALQTFSHPALTRSFKWNLPEALWIKDELHAISSSRHKQLLTDIIESFEEILPTLLNYPAVTVHNDLNDYNILVATDTKGAASISGLIDLGDIAKAPRVCDLAICAAYVVLDHPNPAKALELLVSGYHFAHPLSEDEIGLVFPLLKMRLAVSVVNSTLMAAESPDDPYIVISQAPAWRFLESSGQFEELINIRLRLACGFPIHDHANEILSELERKRGDYFPLLGKSIEAMPRGALSVKEASVPIDPFNLSPEEALNINHVLNLGDEWLGLYGEPRLVYTSSAFRQGQNEGQNENKASNRRTVHLAVDVFAKEGHELYALLDGWVVTVENRAHHLDYGGVVILRHQSELGHNFYTLYGHLNPEVTEALSEGQLIKRGESFCRIGCPSENGGWPPHVHFQLALTTQGMGCDWPGVAAPDEMPLWGAMCPNPAALLNLSDDFVAYQGIDQPEISQLRKAHFGKNLKLSYQKPLTFLRGWKHHLFDEAGRPYLDAYNNVPHVGHAHPRIQAVAADQLKRINSNTRYLHPAQTEFAQKLLSKCPPSLSVCYFVNSGSEANELAMRLARAHSGGKDMITPNHGYHGNTTGAIDISAYKFNKPGGSGRQDWVQLVDVADDYQGPFKRSDPQCAQKYAAQIDTAIDNISSRGGQLAGFIAETFPSVGGQIIPPQGYLKAVYKKIRDAGGVCIADEVQTGLGRLGEYYFGFEQQRAVPDIVVLGKPIGNGHPIGVVITTPEIAQCFANGIEYFSTFGGSTLSCRIGKEVLDIIDDEQLSTNAQVSGLELLCGLSSLQEKHAIIGDIRGMGLFIGVELVSDRTSQTPATEVADYVLNRMREHRILIGTEGPFDSVLKIRPPLTIDQQHIQFLLNTLDQVLSESFVKGNSAFTK